LVLGNVKILGKAAVVECAAAFGDISWQEEKMEKAVRMIVMFVIAGLIFGVIAVVGVFFMGYVPNLGVQTSQPNVEVIEGQFDREVIGESQVE